MPDDFFPELKRFIELNVESVPQLEALLLLRDSPSTSWDAAALAKSLYIPPDAAASLLNDFSRRGFVEVATDKSHFRYLVADERVDRLIGELRDAYHNRRVAVISLIYSKPIHKVQTFADAFRFGKENLQ